MNREEQPDCLHKCTIAVKLASDRHAAKLKPQDVQNSKTFAKLMQRLRREQVAAILGKDKYGRFGILLPMPSSGQSEERYPAEDFAAQVQVGEIQEVMEFLAQRAAVASTTSLEHPPPQDTSAADSGMWKPPGADDTNDTSNDDSGGLWKPPGADDDEPTTNEESTGLWQPPGADDNNGGDAFYTGFSEQADAETNVSKKRGFEDISQDDNDKNGSSEFHQDEGAAAADTFYSNLTRKLETRAASRIYHMRAFNGWVKATQIAELDPRIIQNGKLVPKGPLRILDLACGKGGDLTKWTLHQRGIGNYVGSDVARGSLKDAAIRARELRQRNKLKSAVFCCADLGADVPGRKKSKDHKHMQKLLTWNMSDETVYESGEPEFKLVRGGGIQESDKFDVVSIQFAIHYMMSSRKRALRFFHTVSQLLEVGGNLVCTTIDARMVISHMLNLGLDLHFEDGKEPAFDEAVVVTGEGACRLRFEPTIVKKLFSSKSDGSKAEEDLFGLQYTFTLVEGSDHGAGVGDAVNLPEWLAPIPVLKALAEEAGLELEYAQNFHEFFEARKDPSAHPSAHHALYNMKVLNRLGSISEQEWSISRMYAAIKFRKVRESKIVIEENEEVESDSEDEQAEEVVPPPQPAKAKVEIDPMKAKMLLPKAMMQAKRVAGAEKWNSLSSEEKKVLTQVELEKLAKT